MRQYSILIHKQYCEFEQKVNTVFSYAWMLKKKYQVQLLFNSDYFLSIHILIILITHSKKKKEKRKKQTRKIYYQKYIMDSIFHIRNFYIDNSFICSVPIYIQDYSQEKKWLKIMNYQVVHVLRQAKRFSHCVLYCSFKREDHEINIFLIWQSHNGLCFLVDDQPVSSNLKKPYYYFKKRKHWGLFVKPLPFLRFFLGLFVTNFLLFYQLLTWHVLSLKTKLNSFLQSFKKHAHK